MSVLHLKLERSSSDKASEGLFLHSHRQDEKATIILQTRQRDTGGYGCTCRCPLARGVRDIGVCYEGSRGTGTSSK